MNAAADLGRASVLDRPTTVGEYVATDTFRAHDRHACVAFLDDGGLVAVTGPADDRDAQRVALLYAAAPHLLESAQVLLAALRSCADMGDDVEAACRSLAHACYSALVDPSAVQWRDVEAQP